MTAPRAEDVAAFAAAMSASERVLFITGAGLSADSGLPTYRGIGGLYEREHTDDGIPIEAALSGRMLARDPALCWKYIHEIERACRGAQPNAAHRVMAALERRFDAWVLTQNVDGLHRAAGSTRVIEIHGDVHDLACTRCEHRRRVEDFAGLEIPPACPVAGCAALVRPEVVLFGEILPARAVGDLRRELRTGFDLVVSVGTTSTFPYIAEPVLVARELGRPTIEVNPGASAVSELVGLRIRAGAAATFAALGDALGLGPAM
ncbi:MAG TPA: NAD-dependent protein deacylase [Nannocystaceae bacterium]|nr:NAD-dependent protein deacylase [Nannocystaceae bacterium]